MALAVHTYSPHDLQLIKLLGDDLYTTYLANHRGKPCVVKFFTHKSDRNNEYAVLELLQERSSHPEWYPKPYFRVELNDDADLFVGCLSDEGMLLLQGVYEIICYEYFEGYELDQTPSPSGEIEEERAREDLTRQLQDLHSLGLVFDDVRRGSITHRVNVIYATELQRYLLIDYGRVFHPTDSSLPPMEYMTVDDELPTQEEDWRGLDRVLNSKP